MKFAVHAVVQLVVFAVSFVFLGLAPAVFIVAFHFIPSIDFVLKKINFRADLHRRLAHNLFVALAAALLAVYFTPTAWAVTATLNLLLHLGMDSQGNGVALFYPVSEYRFKFFG